MLAPLHTHSQSLSSGGTWNHRITVGTRASFARNKRPRHPCAPNVPQLESQPSELPRFAPSVRFGAASCRSDGCENDPMCHSVSGRSLTPAHRRTSLGGRKRMFTIPKQTKENQRRTIHKKQRTLQKRLRRTHARTHTHTHTHTHNAVLSTTDIEEYIPCRRDAASWD